MHCRRPQTRPQPPSAGTEPPRVGPLRGAAPLRPGTRRAPPAGRASVRGPLPPRRRRADAKPQYRYSRGRPPATRRRPPATRRRPPPPGAGARAAGARTPRLIPASHPSLPGPHGARRGRMRGSMRVQPGPAAAVSTRRSRAHGCMVSPLPPKPAGARSHDPARALSQDASPLLFSHPIARAAGIHCRLPLDYRRSRRGQRAARRLPPLVHPHVRLERSSMPFKT
jgi:hypothetical protein